MADHTDSSSSDRDGSITALLDRTTPHRVAPLDVDDLSRRGRHRRRRNQAALVTGVVTVMVVFAVATAGLLSSSDEPSDGPSDVGMAVPGPDGEPLTEPVGSWHEGAEAPFSPRTEAFTGTLSDGRIVVWGGVSDGTSTQPLDGGIYDPGSGEWTSIPAAPLPEVSSTYAVDSSIQLVDDRLAVVMGSPLEDGGIYAAVYDVAAGRWDEAPPQDDIVVHHDGAGWDGETLALVKLDPGTGDYTDSDRGAAMSQPITLRWSPGDEAWQQGAPSPLGLRSYAGHAFDGQRLAFWGGAYPEVMSDGALYDVASDSWQPLPAAPLSGRTQPLVAWSNGRLLVGGGSEQLPNASGHLSDLAAFDPTTGAWQTLAPPPIPLAGLASGEEFVAGNEPVLLASDPQGLGGGEPWFFVDDRWEQAPLPEVYGLDGFVVATSGSHGTPLEESIGVQVRAGRDTWLDAVEAPLGNREGALVGSSGTQLLIVGGWDGDEMRTDTWIFDLSG